MGNRRQFLSTVVRSSVGLGAWSVLGAEGRQATAWTPPRGLGEDDFWEMVRSQFPLTRERTYLNTGGLGPAPYPVLDAMHRTTMALQRISEHGHECIEEARAPVAAFLGVRPEEVAFMRNATEGNSTVASGLKMERGDEVIFESHAHPGGSIPWLNRRKRDGIVVKIFEPDPTSTAGNLERIERLITPRTRVIQVSHMTAPTGIVFPVKEIAGLAKEHDCWFHVDGAQTAGTFPFDLTAVGCDSYATSGHKWMCAPHGTGILYVRQERLDEVAPTDVGAYTESELELPDVYEYHPTARRYESGTRDAASIVGIVAAIGFLEQIGMKRVARYGQHLARYLHEQLREIPGVTVLTPEDPSLSASMTTFKTDQVPYKELYSYFVDEHRLRCRIVSERGLDAIRVSTHIFNSEADCDRVVEATRAALAEQ